MGKDVVEQGLGAKLDTTGDELGFGISSKRVYERIATGLPLVSTIETKLRSVSMSEGKERKHETYPNKCVNAKTVVPCSIDDLIAGHSS